MDDFTGSALDVANKLIPTRVSANEKPLIFLSHISEHRDLGIFFKREIQNAFKHQVEVFVSSDIKDIAGGEEWKKAIKEALRNTRLFIVVLNEASLKRHWINLEIGCAWILDRPILALCFGAVKKGSLPKPYDDFKALEFPTSAFHEELMSTLEKQLGEPFRAVRYPEQFAEQLAAFLPVISLVQETEATVPKPDLSDEELKILLIVADRKGVTASTVASVSGLRRPKCEAILAKLKHQGMVAHAFHVVGDGAAWQPTDEARIFLYDSNLL
jgi:hypothetical protein